MSVKFSKKQVIIIIGGIVLVIAVFVLIFLGLQPKPNTGPSVTLTVWGTGDAAIGSTFASYPYGRINYVEVDAANYTSRLLSALAAGTGPDVFEINNRDLPKWKSVLAPLPTSSTQFGTLALQSEFPDVVAQDFVSDGQIYGLPLSIDTLVMVYNKDLLNSAGIAVLPKTWNELDADVVKLRTVNAQGQLTQAAAAIGGSLASIPYAPDLLSLLMLQNGTQMTSGKNIATFAGQGGGATGIAAFNFYLQFANAASPYYTWNDTMGNAIDSFVAGKTAIVFAYQSDLARIRAKAPFLNVGIAPVPQAEGASVAINYPNYNGFVAARAGQTAVAWNFILYLTTIPANAAAYQNATGRPPALRAMIQGEASDPNLSVFALQALTARSWYEADAARTDAIFDVAIRNVLSGAKDPVKALTEAETSVSQLMR